MQFTILMMAASLLSMSMLTACDKSSGATATTAANGAKVSGGPLQETAASNGQQVAWSTGATVSQDRQIEVGDHPNIQLEKFELGNRAARVRFMVADDAGAKKYVSGSPQDLLFQSDAPIAKSENDKWSMFSMVIDAPANLGLASFSNDSGFNGLAVSPQMILCASSALQNLKDASTSRGRIYQNWQINDINIFVKPVQHSADAESKMAIDAHGHALNFQISLWTRSGDCFTPTAEQIGEALDIADQRVQD